MDIKRDAIVINGKLIIHIPTDSLQRLFF